MTRRIYPLVSVPQNRQTTLLNSDRNLLRRFERGSGVSARPVCVGVGILFPRRRFIIDRLAEGGHGTSEYDDGEGDD